MKKRRYNLLILNSLIFTSFCGSFLISLNSCSKNEVNQVSITYNYDSSMGKVEGKTEARPGEVITITITANEGYKVYKINDEEITSSEYEYTVKKENNVINVEFKKVSVGSIVINSVTVGILHEIEVIPSYYGDFTSKELSFEVEEAYKENFIIEKNSGDQDTFSFKITGLLTCEKVSVKAFNSEGISTNFKVTVKESTYKEATSATSENWFDDISVDKVSNLSSSLSLGLDVSYVKQVYDNGGAYFSKSGEEEPIFKILKDSGVNIIRIKQFVDPYNYNNLDENNNPITYGGGINDLETNLWIAKFASYYSLNICIDLHYSDFYADPSNQVLPKSWKDVTTSDELATKVYNYTKETLNAYKENNINISSIQIGNETTTGILLQSPGDDYNYLTNGNPGYIQNKKSLGSSLSGTARSSNFVKYIENGVNAAKEVFPNIQTIIHVAKGFSDKNFYYNYFSSLNDVNYDVIGVSSYIYYQGDASNAKSLMSYLKESFPNKKILIAETSYGFTDASSSYASNSFYSSNSSGSPRKINYDVSVLGQATLIRDYVEAINSLGDNAYGLFYWGGDMIPVSGYGWGDSSTLSSWANQALFSYGGKALPSLEVFNLIK